MVTHPIGKEWGIFSEEKRQLVAVMPSFVSAMEILARWKADQKESDDRYRMALLASRLSLHGCGIEVDLDAELVKELGGRMI